MVKTMFGVEHYYASEDSSTYEIFPTLPEAKSFCAEQSLWSEGHYPLYIFKAKFNPERIFQEDDLGGQWNYEDYMDTIIEYDDLFVEINKKSGVV